MSGNLATITTTFHLADWNELLAAPATEFVGEPLSCYLISEQSYSRDGKLKSNVVMGVLWAPEDIDLLQTALAYHTMRDRCDEYGLTRMLVETEHMVAIEADAYDGIHFLPDVMVERVSVVGAGEADSPLWIVETSGGVRFITSSEEVLDRGLDTVKMLSSKDTTRPHITYLHDTIEVRIGAESGSLICRMNRHNGPILIVWDGTPTSGQFRECWDAYVEPSDENESIN